MNEDTIRKRLRTALGESNYPPAFTSQVAARLAEPVHQEHHTWVLAVVAAALALAVVATLVFGVRGLHPRADVPVKAPPVALVPGNSTCPGYGQIAMASGNDSPHPVKMSTATTGWASGGLRTTDGGAHWRDVSPSALRDDAPNQLAKALAPPGYADFYLDANNAWEARNYASATSCYDHIATFATSDGGRTWRLSEPVALNLKPGWGAYAQMFFVDPRKGWLWVRKGEVAQGGFWGMESAPLSEGDLYGTEDGGLHWRLISNLVASKLGISVSKTCSSPLGGNLVFASPSNGWMPICQGTDRDLLMTNDGGATWSRQKLPTQASVAACSCVVQTPRFGDPRNGLIQVSSYVDPSSLWLLGTIDGGRTWQAVPRPGTGFVLQLDFVDANHLWALVTPPGWSKTSSAGFELYRTTNSGQTWTLVRTLVPAAWPPGYLQFVDAQNGFEASINGASELLVTADGGLSWQVIKPTIERAQ
jgi:photosystem II stability/assembly factor-like uncharacterized protein